MLHEIDQNTKDLQFSKVKVDLRSTIKEKKKRTRKRNKEVRAQQSKVRKIQSRRTAREEQSSSPGEAPEENGKEEEVVDARKNEILC